MFFLGFFLVLCWGFRSVLLGFSTQFSLVFSDVCVGVYLAFSLGFSDQFSLVFSGVCVRVFLVFFLGSFLHGVPCFFLVLV